MRGGSNATPIAREQVASLENRSGSNAVKPGRHYVIDKRILDTPGAGIGQQQKVRVDRNRANESAIVCM